MDPEYGRKQHEDPDHDEERTSLLSQQQPPSPAQPLPAQPREKGNPIFVWTLLICACVAVSSAATAFDKMGDVPSVTLASWRLQLTSVLLLPPFVWQWRRMGPLQRQQTLASVWMLLSSGAFLGVHFGLWVWGLEHTTLSHSLLFVCSTPVILAALSILMRQPISTGEVLGTLLALAGGAILAFGASGALEQGVHLSGDVASFLAAAAIIGYLKIGSTLRQWMPVFIYACPVTAVGALLLTLAGFISDGPHVSVGWLWLGNSRYLLWTLYLAFIPGLVGHTGFNTLLRYLPALTISLAVSLEPVVGSFIGWAAGVAGPPSGATLGGGALMLGATAIVTWASNRREAAAAAAASAAGRTSDGGVCGGCNGGNSASNARRGAGTDSAAASREGDGCSTAAAAADAAGSTGWDAVRRSPTEEATEPGHASASGSGTDGRHGGRELGEGGGRRDAPHRPLNHGGQLLAGRVSSANGGGVANGGGRGRSAEAHILMTALSSTGNDVGNGTGSYGVGNGVGLGAGDVVGKRPPPS